jgi:hypothetical protein
VDSTTAQRVATIQLVRQLVKPYTCERLIHTKWNGTVSAPGISHISRTLTLANAAQAPRMRRLVVGGSAAGGFTGPVALSVSGLPSGATATFTPATVTTSGTSTLAVRTTTGTARGTFTLRIAGTSGSLSHQVTVSLTVT